MSLDLENEVRALFREKMMEFFGWAEANWTLKPSDKEDEWLAEKSEDYLDGYNAAIEGLKTAFECWNEEFGP